MGGFLLALLITDEADSETPAFGRSGTVSAPLSVQPEWRTKTEQVAAAKKVAQYNTVKWILDTQYQERVNHYWIVAEQERQALATSQQSTASSSGPSYPAATGYTGGSAKAFIYEHESGNDPYAVNPSSGACGLCQALPCEKMGCALGDYACQDAWCESYAYSRYGSWEAAMDFWLSHRWW